MKKTKVMGVIVGCIILLLIVGSILEPMVKKYNSTLKNVAIGTEVLDILNKTLLWEKQSFELNIEANVGEADMDFSSTIYMLKDATSPIVVVESDGYSMYFSKEAMFFENGKAYRLTEGNAVDGFVLEQIVPLFHIMDVQKVQQSDRIIYSIMPKGGDAKALLEACGLPLEGQIVATKDVRLSIIAKNDILQDIKIEGEATLDDSDKTEIQLSVSFCDFKEAKDYKLPQQVENAMTNTKVEELPAIGESIYRLFLAWMNFDGQKQTGDVLVDVACGPINFEVKDRWEDICNRMEHAPSDGSQAESGMEAIPGVLYEVCLNGELSCEQSENMDIFRMKVGEETIKLLSEIIAPELKGQVVHFDQGTVVVVVRENEIDSFQIRLDGEVTVLFAKVDAYINAEFCFDR